MAAKHQPTTDSEADLPEPSPARRTFMAWLSGLILAAGSILAAFPIIGFLLGPVVRPRRDQWVALGKVSEFPLQQTRMVVTENPLRAPADGVTGKIAAYVRRLEGDEFQVMSLHCAHLGCPVNWFPESELFLCPCHGGVYYADGARASGPPPRGLFQFEHRIEKGQLMVKMGHLPTLQDPLSPDSETSEMNA